ncbi:MAG: LysR family transcriptional regulator [Pseudomonadota bacterium]|nr:LysR family transcriptional regulator [Pseudomonadota bacterium]
MDNLTHLDWTLVRNFLAVAEAGSLSAAARQLRVSQPTLGRQMKQIEQDLGVTLFLRQPRGLALSEAGRTMLPAARRMQEAMSEIALTVAGRDTEARGPVRITASEVVAQQILPPILGQLRRHHPEITLDLTASDSSDNLLFREADIAIRMYRPTQLEVVTRKLGDLQMAVCAAESYLQDRPMPHQPQDLLDQDHALVGYDQSELILRGMRDLGWPATRDWFATRCDAQNTYWELIKSGCGIGFGQRWLIDQTPDVRRLDLGLEVPALPVWLATPQALRNIPRISTVWQALESGLRPFIS